MQSSPLDEHATITVLPVTSTLVDTPMLRVTVQPGLKNGLQKPFQVMVGKAMALRRNKVGLAFGCVVADAMVEVERCLAVFLGFVKKSVAASGFAVRELPDRRVARLAKSRNLASSVSWPVFPRTYRHCPSTRSSFIAKSMV